MPDELDMLRAEAHDLRKALRMVLAENSRLEAANAHQAKALLRLHNDFRALRSLPPQPMQVKAKRKPSAFLSRVVKAYLAPDRFRRRRTP